MENKISDNIPLSYLTAFLFVLSLAYFLGYLYGLGIRPSSIPLTAIDITNGILNNLSLSLVVMIITTCLFKFQKIPMENIKENNSAQTHHPIPPFLYGTILFIVISIIAYRGATLPLYLIGLILFLNFINSLHTPEYIPDYYFNILKLGIILLAIMFSIGFTSGYFKFYETRNIEVVTLTNSTTYKCHVLAYLTSGMLIKNNNKIVFINEPMLQSVEYQPSRSYLEAKASKE
jgi:hypothetical protein